MQLSRGSTCLRSNTMGERKPALESTLQQILIVSRWIMTLLAHISGIFKHRIWDSEEQHPALQPLCRCYTEHDAKRLEMRPLIAAWFHNQTCVPLFRLPEEILLKIMLRLGPRTLESLRRTSRLFARIFLDPSISRLYDISKDGIRLYPTSFIPFNGEISFLGTPLQAILRLHPSAPSVRFLSRYA
jgi:hypothetical protein